MKTKQAQPTPGERARTARLARGLNQKQVAAAIGVDQSSLSRFERGESDRLNDGRIVELARVLGVATTDLDPALAGACCPTCGRPLDPDPKPVLP